MKMVLCGLPSVRLCPHITEVKEDRRMILKYNIEIENEAISRRLKNLVNQVYKLLPIREEGDDWEKPLQTVMEELAGIQRLMNCGYPDIFFPLLSKLEGLYSLVEEEDFSCYRRTIFECLGLLNTLREEICPLKR